MGVVTDSEGSSGEKERARRRRLAEVFGDVLPETTSDEQTAAGTDDRGSERWYRENRPPHHSAE
jgi:hypothetical protein